jgi:hypothetical protein
MSLRRGEYFKNFHILVPKFDFPLETDGYKNIGLSFLYFRTIIFIFLDFDDRRGSIRGTIFDGCYQKSTVAADMERKRTWSMNNRILGR